MSEAGEEADGEVIPSEWLRERISIEQVEADHIREGESFSHARWLELKAQMVEGDELWSFCSDDSSWQDLCGRAGIALVRQGRAIDGIVMLTN